jgi:hypothetical protein
MTEYHHAYVISAPRERGLFEARARIGEILGDLTAHPDFFTEEFATLSVEHARELQERAARKPIGGDRKAFLIVFDFITLEAQNALLKLLEEPPLGTHFFLVVPTAEILLPTVRSRLEEVKVHGEHVPVPMEAKDFLAATPADRILMIGKIAAAKDKARAIGLLDGMTALLHESLTKKPDNAELMGALEEVAAARTYLGDRSPSIKMLLEHVALSIPRTI